MEAPARRMTRVAAWNIGNEEEARAYLQARLMVLSSHMFWSFVAFVGFLSILYGVAPDLEPEHNTIIFAGAAIGLILLALIWRVGLARNRFSIARLNQVDAFYAIGTGLLFGLGGYLATDFEPAPYMTLLYACLTVLTRAIVVPSTGRRTLVISSILLAPFFVASVLIVITKPAGDVGVVVALPPAALITSVLLICSVTVLLAANGSQTSYGLRQEARAAMQLGQYTLDRKIGEGAMGAVYVAHHVLLRRPTAIKLLQPEKVGTQMLDRFEREVQHTSKLSHPNTVAVFDYGRSPDGVFYYAMEYLDGIDLEKLVQLEGKQPAGRVSEILVQVCGALHEAHATGLVHRDIKPANIILCERGAMPDVAKVVDFGLVKELAAEGGTTTHMIEGTPAYMSPEAVTSADKVAAPADIYSLGCVGYFLLTGTRVFEGKSALEVCIQQATATPRPLIEVWPEAPPALAQLIMRCLDKSPAARPTALELSRALRELGPLGDWSEAAARTWWLEFRQRRTPVTTTRDATLTITIDLESRAAVEATVRVPS